MRMENVVKYLDILLDASGPFVLESRGKTITFRY